MDRKKKIIFVMIDGIADVSIPELGNLSTLQSARTPTFDGLARAGLCGVMDPVEPGLACGSDTAHLSIFGYPPRQFYRGRGAFESMGAGLEMAPGDIAFKSNFATIDPESKIVLNRRASRHFEHIGPTLCEYLNGCNLLPSFPDCTVTFKYATEHRCGVRVRGPHLTDTITGTDPLKDNRLLLKCTPITDPGTNEDDAARTSAIVNELTDRVHHFLDQHPYNLERVQHGKNKANMVLFRGCGIRLEVPSFIDRHGFRGFMIAPTAIIAGLGMNIGLKVFVPPGASGDYNTNLSAKANCCLDLMGIRGRSSTFSADDFDFAFVHVKAVDDAGHDKNVDLKKRFLERIDDELVRLIVEEIAAEVTAGSTTEYIICLTGDHSTPVLSGDHSHEPVPFLICSMSEYIRLAAHENENSSSGNPNSQSSAFRDTVDRFDEQCCAQGILGRFPGREVMTLVKNFTAAI